LLAGLLALASVLGVGEGHLLHRETRWVGSRYFAKSESLFQSFPRDADNVSSSRHKGWTGENLKSTTRCNGLKGSGKYPLSKFNPTPATAECFIHGLGSDTRLSCGFGRLETIHQHQSSGILSRTSTQAHQLRQG
ncbi:hypothetical protein J1N39_33785, partial [Pseudomonas aeruginosa]|nr:hypothetical protein [Pseudomonas aeruginosa]MBZ3690850.1 hypothetical protein [Pseudomonas aeruginosa]